MQVVLDLGLDGLIRAYAPEMCVDGVPSARTLASAGAAAELIVPVAILAIFPDCASSAVRW
jgi:hypothetical protein